MERPLAASASASTWPAVGGAPAHLVLPLALDDRPAVDANTFGALLDLIGLAERGQFLAHIRADFDRLGRRIEEAADDGDGHALARAAHALAGLAATLGAGRLADLARRHCAPRTRDLAALRHAAARFEAELVAAGAACARLADARRPV